MNSNKILNELIYHGQVNLRIHGKPIKKIEEKHTYDPVGGVKCETIYHLKGGETVSHKSGDEEPMLTFVCPTKKVRHSYGKY